MIHSDSTTVAKIPASLAWSIERGYQARERSKLYVLIELIDRAQYEEGVTEFRIRDFARSARWSPEKMKGFILALESEGVLEAEKGSKRGLTRITFPDYHLYRSDREG